MHTLSFILLFASILSILYGIYATISTWDFFKTANRAGDPKWPPVSIVKPLARLEPNYRRNFESFCRQNYPRFELVFAFPPGNDPLISLLEELKREFPDREMHWVTADPARGPNYKVGNLIAAVEKAQYPVLAISDGDMLATPEYLKDTVREFSRNKVGLVTSLYRNVGVDNLFGALQALTVQTVFIPNVLFSRRMEGLSYAFGATLCTSKRILAEIGGAESLLEYLADDYQFGNRIRGKGYEVGLSPALIDQVSQTKGFRDYFLQQLRAGITQRVCRPVGYFGSIITHQVALSLFFLLVEGFSPLGWAVFLASCALRVLSGLILNRTAIRNHDLGRYLWLIPVNDLMNSLLWLLSLFTRTVTWKGRKFRVLKGGKMVERRRAK